MRDQAERDKINNIFGKAKAAGRDILFEHEVYQILSIAGIDTPKFKFVKDPAQITKNDLERFGSELILKIVSPDIVHKQKLGGVKKVTTDEVLYIRFLLEQMRITVLSHFPDNEKPVIEGFLITEFISHTQAIGYEILLGISEDDAFGPVVTLSKGGDDAEFFSKYYDPANLFLPPLTKKEAKALSETLKVRHKYNDIGRTEYIDLIADAAYKFGRLAYTYSHVSPKKPEYIIKELDVNPFVISDDGRFIAVDGFARFYKRDEKAGRLKKVNTRALEYLFEPEGIAVIGVSLDPEKYSMGREIAILLDDMDRKDVYLVNRKGGEIKINNTLYPLYKSINDITKKVDLIVYTASALTLTDFAREIKKPGYKAMIIISGVPSEIDFMKLKEDLKKLLPQELRILGPNCMGVYKAPDVNTLGINTLFIEKEKLELKSSARSNAVLLTQSGGVALTEIDKLNNSRVFKSIVSFGNKMDISVPDLTKYFMADNSIDVISLYVEGFDTGEGREFYHLADKTKKPIVVYKAGKTQAGARAARSHTASMSGSYDVFKAACRQKGVVIAEKIEDHFEYIKAFSLLAKKKPKGRSVAFVLNAGFESTVGADELFELIPAVLADKTRQALKSIDKHGLIDYSTSLLDLTPLADDTFYAQVARQLLDDDNVDCVVVSVLPHTKYIKTDEKTYNDPDSLANQLIRLWQKTNKPFVVSVNGGKHFKDFVSLLEENGLPVFSDIRKAVSSLEAFVKFHTTQKNRERLL